MRHAAFLGIQVSTTKKISKRDGWRDGEDRKNGRWASQQDKEPAAAAIPEGIEQGGKGREEAGRSCGQHRSSSASEARGAEISSESVTLQLQLTCCPRCILVTSIVLTSEKEISSESVTLQLQLTQIRSSQHTWIRTMGTWKEQNILLPIHQK